MSSSVFTQSSIDVLKELGQCNKILFNERLLLPHCTCSIHIIISLVLDYHVFVLKIKHMNKQVFDCTVTDKIKLSLNLSCKSFQNKLSLFYVYSNFFNVLL